jgi:hypothetical protein
MKASYEERCDIRIGSEDCIQADATSMSAKYLCMTCGKIDNLDHEVCHNFYSNVSGHYQTLS